MEYYRENQIQLIHAHNIAPLIYGGIAAKILHPKIPVIYSEHNQVYRLSRWGRRKFKFYLRFSDHIATVSERLREFYRTDLGITRDISVLYNGINPDIYKYTNSTGLREKIGIGENDFVVGTAVVLSKQKGIPYLLDAAKILAVQYPDIKIVIAGDGPDRSKLEALCHSSGLCDTVRFLGYRDDIPKLLSSFNAYILPSLWEGLPLALIESLAVGKPAIATDVGGNSEIIQDGVNGLIVPAKDAQALADAIIQLYNQRGALDQFRERNIARFNCTFSLASMLSAHEQLYLKMACS
jgi:glycosyltransferase involved in cell wall biosynthesis